MRNRTKFQPAISDRDLREQLKSDMQTVMSRLNESLDKLQKQTADPQNQKPLDLKPITDMVGMVLTQVNEIVKQTNMQADQLQGQPGLDLEHLAQIVDAMRESTARPSHVGVVVMRNSEGEITGMVATSDPDEIEANFGPPRNLF